MRCMPRRIWLIRIGSRSRRAWLIHMIDKKSGRDPAGGSAPGQPAPIVTSYAMFWLRWSWIDTAAARRLPNVEYARSEDGS